MADKPVPIEIGVAMWRMLSDSFQHVAQANDLMRHEQRAQLWTGFMGAAFGAMCRDLGVFDAKLILEHGIAKAMNDGIAEDLKRGQH